MKIEHKPPPKSVAKRIWHVIRVLYYMLHKSVSKHKLMVDLNLHLLLKRSKIAVKSICNLLGASHHHHDKSSCVDREIEFSCSNTPFQAMKRRGKHHCRYESCDHVPYDHVSAIAKAFEILNSEVMVDDNINLVMWSPTPRARQLRATDSPFPIREEGEGRAGGSQVDREAEEFIKRFYEQLRLQQQQIRNCGGGCMHMRYEH